MVLFNQFSRGLLGTTILICMVYTDTQNTHIIGFRCISTYLYLLAKSMIELDKFFVSLYEFRTVRGGRMNAMDI